METSGTAESVHHDGGSITERNDTRHTAAQLQLQSHCPTGFCREVGGHHSHGDVSGMWRIWNGMFSVRVAC